MRPADFMEEILHYSQPAVRFEEFLLVQSDEVIVLVTRKGTGEKFKISVRSGE